MSYWNVPTEQKPPVIVVYSSDRRIGACVLYPDKSRNETLFSIYGIKWRLETSPKPQEENPENWIELWPISSLVAKSFAEAIKLQKQFLYQLENEDNPETYKVIYPDMALVHEIHTQDNQYLTRMFKRKDGLFEVRYYSWTQGRGGGWIQERINVTTLSSDMDSAFQAAQVELAQIRLQTTTDF